MKFYFIAGERSGDLHASNLIKAIRKQAPESEFRAWGGDLMAAEGASLVKHYKELAFMGFLEVARNLPTILGFMKECQRDILAYRPDVVVLVDYAGFNMRIARFCKKHNIRVFYYISPKVWAWNQSRAYKIKATVDRMFVIFPFEQEFFRQYDYAVDFVGNPLLDAIQAYVPAPDFRRSQGLTEKPVIALLPGSRRQEVEKMLALMLSVVPAFPEHQFVIAAVSNLPESFYAPFTRLERVSVVYDQTYDLLANAEAALVTSGTATLETALFEVPQVVCYKTGMVSYQIARALIKVKYISLVNLIAGREVVKELIQQSLNTANLTSELKKLLPGGSGRQEQVNAYRAIKSAMGSAGASETAAHLMVRYLQEGTRQAKLIE
jgi:lipid-A-disaccharide synthase